MSKRHPGLADGYRGNFQERTFCLNAKIGIMVLAFMIVRGLIAGENMEYILALALCLLYVILVALASVFKKRMDIGAMLIAVLFLLLFTVNFFAAGGVYSSGPLWLAFLFVYGSLMLDGMYRIIFFLFCVAATLLCHYMALYHPEYLRQQTLSIACRDSALSVILVGGSISAMVLLQDFIYQEENKRINQQKKEIEELIQEGNYFFSSISHEIRTSLNAMVGLNEIILRSNVREDITENARAIQRMGGMLLTFLKDMLDMSKIRAGKMDIVNAPYGTGNFFSDIANMAWAKAKEKGLEFYLEVDDSIPGQLSGDQVRIQQVLLNLLDNAIKYTDQGSVTLSVQCERKKGNRVSVGYSVQDTGQGIRQEDIPYLFDAFWRVNEEKNAHIEGSGLGLSIVKQLVDFMGGEISVISVYGKGSVFFVKLEQDIAEEKELGIFPLEPCTGKEDAIRCRRFEAPDAHLLVVDDSEINRAVVRKLLSPAKIQVDAASGGAECLRMTGEKYYDVILMDHLMPEMDGVECFHAIRTQAEGMCREAPVIALTAHAGSENQLFYEKEGFDGCLAKPVSGALLEEAVLGILPKELVRMIHG